MKAAFLPLKLLTLIATVMPVTSIAEAVGSETIRSSIPMRQEAARYGKDGVVIRTYSATQAHRTGLTFVFIENACSRCSARVRVIKEFGSSYDIYRRMTPANAALAMNGSFFGYDAKGKHIPLGLVIADSDRNNRRIGWTGGGYLVHSSNGDTKIIPAAKYRHTSADLDVVQSKPLLVEEGRNGIRRDDGERFNRTAFAISTSGKLIIAGAFEGFGRSASLYEFAEFLLGIRASDGSSIQWALAMDGGPGAQIYVPSLRLHFGDPGHNYVPNLVYLR